MKNLDDNIKNPLNINKYNLLKLRLDITGLNKSEQFKIACKLMTLIEDQYDESTSYNDLVAPHVFEYDEENHSVCYILSDDFYKNAFKHGLNELNINYEFADITDDFLNLKIDIECKNDKDIEDYNDFLEITEEFKISHINTDKILEKISDKGIESLTISEKAYLDNH